MDELSNVKIDDTIDRLHPLVPPPPLVLSFWPCFDRHHHIITIMPSPPPGFRAADQRVRQRAHQARQAGDLCSSSRERVIGFHGLPEQSRETVLQAKRPVLASEQQ